jgi:hypothetical protein
VGENYDRNDRPENLLRLIVLLEKADKATRDCFFEIIINYTLIRTAHHAASREQFIEGLFNEPRKTITKTKGGKSK